MPRNASAKSRPTPNRTPPPKKLSLISPRTAAQQYRRKTRRMPFAGNRAERRRYARFGG